MKPSTLKQIVTIALTVALGLCLQQEANGQNTVCPKDLLFSNGPYYFYNSILCQPGSQNSCINGGAQSNILVFAAEQFPTGCGGQDGMGNCTCLNPDTAIGNDGGGANDLVIPRGQSVRNGSESPSYLWARVRQESGRWEFYKLFRDFETNGPENIAVRLNARPQKPGIVFHTATRVDTEYFLTLNSVRYDIIVQ